MIHSGHCHSRVNGSVCLCVRCTHGP